LQRVAGAGKAIRKDADEWAPEGEQKAKYASRSRFLRYQKRHMNVCAERTLKNALSRVAPQEFLLLSLQVRIVGMRVFFFGKAPPGR